MASSAPCRVNTPTSRPASSITGATRWLPAVSRSNAVSPSIPFGNVSRSVDITIRSWVNRSTPAQSASVTIPTGRPANGASGRSPSYPGSGSATTTAPWARFGSNPSASETVSVGRSTTGVSYTVCRCFTQLITSVTTSTGMSCGMIANPPRRASVSAIRRPDTAVMFEATTGSVVPVPSAVVRSTSVRDPIDERCGIRYTSLYVRSA